MDMAKVFCENGQNQVMADFFDYNYSRLFKQFYNPIVGT